MLAEPKASDAQFFLVSAFHGVYVFRNQPLSYSFTNFAYSSSGTPSFLAIATCEGESLTVLRPLFDEREAVDSAEATLGLAAFFGSSC